MKFITGNIDELNVSDAEISELLRLVYVEGGFTSAEVANRVFTPDAVKARGYFLGAREIASNEFSGMIIVVPPTSTAKFRGHKLNY